ARELLAAAMAFDVGSRATLNLALLDLAQGDEPDLPKNLAIDSLLAASLVARHEPALAVPFLVGQLKVTPNHLGCQCVAAVISQKALVSPHVRTLATKSGANLISLVALLEQPPFGRLAMRFAQTLVDENPGNPAALLLLAKASGNADRPIELQAAFDKIRNQLGSDIVLMTAAFQILSETEHPALQQSKIKDQLAALALRGGASTPPALLALVLKQNSAILKVPGAHNKILPMVKQFWLSFPALSGIGLEEVELLIDSGSHRDAINLLRKIERLLPDEQRGEYLVLYYRAATVLSETATPAERNSLVAEALRRLDKGEIHGAPLHFLLGWLDRALEALTDAAESRVVHDKILTIEGSYLRQHLEMCPATSEAQLHFLQLSLERLANRHGYERAMQSLDAVLRRDPSLIAIWQLRAHWLGHLGRVTEATKSLLWIPQYLDSPEILDILIQLLARSGQLVEKGQEVLSLENLSTASKLSLGLAELRLGRYQTAATTLAAAKPQRDGAHLYYRALALLSLQVPESLGLAKAVLQELIEGHSTSPYRASAAAVLTVL
ncbi:MAG: hypothetical protein VX951_14190, partial [Planctomycetota bacterium]|nr:hypothetical protein [Planctomycetota bacterium]